MIGQWNVYQLMELLNRVKKNELLMRQNQKKKWDLDYQHNKPICHIAHLRYIS